MRLHSDLIRGRAWGVMGAGLLATKDGRICNSSTIAVTYGNASWYITTGQIMYHCLLLSSIANCIIPLTSTSLVLQHWLLPAVASDLAYNRHLLLTPNLLSVMTSACVLCPPNFDLLSPFESSVVATSRSALNFEALSAPPITVLDLEFRLKCFVIWRIYS